MDDVTQDLDAYLGIFDRYCICRCYHEGTVQFQILYRNARSIQDTHRSFLDGHT